MQKTISILLIFTLTILFIGCKNQEGKSIFEPTRVEPPKVEPREWHINDENIGRSSWQKPDFVINKLGDIDGLTIADIGAGTGYFVYRLAYRNANVIAVDIDKQMIDFISSFKENLPSEIRNNVSTRLALPDDPKLDKQEIDIAIIINTISYINNPDQYLLKLKSTFKPGGKILILGYKSKIIDIPAPALEDRLSIGLVETYLLNAGYKNVTVDDKSLEYQYIVMAEVE